MKNFLYLIVAIVVAWILWHLLMRLVWGVIGFAIWIGLILLFCWLVSLVYKAMTRQKI